MGIGVSIFLVAVGAILAFAVQADTRGIDLNVVGVILMIVGAIGLLVSMLIWGSWSPWRREEIVIRETDIAHEAHHHH